MVSKTIDRSDPLQAKKTTSCTVSYKGAVTPKQTKHLKVAKIPLQVEATIELSGPDEKTKDRFQKHFETIMDKRIEAQLGHLNTWISEAEESIDRMMSEVTLNDLEMPTSPSEVSVFQDTIDKAKKRSASIKELLDNYDDFVKDWAENCLVQQAEIAMMEAQKRANAEVLTNKAGRKWAATSGKSALVIIGTAGAVMVAIATAPITIPALVIVGGIAVAISGVSGITKIVRSIEDSVRLQARIMKNAEDDISELENLLKGMDGSKTKLQKHVTELVRVGAKLEDDLSKAQTALQVASAQWGSINGAVNDKKFDCDLVSQAQLTKQRKQTYSNFKAVEDAKLSIKKIVDAQDKIKDMVSRLDKLNVDLNTVQSGKVNSIKSNITGSRKDVETYVSVADGAATVLGMVSAA